MYKEKQIVKGLVTGVTDYGIFLKFDGEYTGVLHISEISNKYVTDINSYAKVGDYIFLKVLEVDNENKHLKLTIKYKENKKYVEIEESKEGFTKLREELDNFIALKKEEMNSRDIA